MSSPEQAYVGRDCIHCKQPLAGRYCQDCGQDNRRRDRTLTELFFDGLSEIFDLDGKVFAAARDMLWRPGRYLIAYREGRTQGYVSPLKMFLVMSALFFVALVWGNLTIYQFGIVRTGEGPITAFLIPNGVQLAGGGLADLYFRTPAGDEPYAEVLQALSAVKPQADPTQAMAITEFEASLNAWGDNNIADKWMPRLLWLFMPVYALVLWPLFGARRPLAEHVVFALWAYAVLFVLLLTYAAFARFVSGASFWLLTIPYLVIFTIAASAYYGAKRWVAALKGLAHVVIFFVFIWVPVVGVLVHAPIWNELPAHYWLADTGPGELWDRYVLPPADPSDIKALSVAGSDR